MNNFRIWVIVGWLLAAAGLHAQSADDQFVRIYNLLQQADQLNDSGETEQAYQKYHEVRAGLKRIQAGYPNWQSKVINFRLNYVADKLAPLEPKYKDKGLIRPQTAVDPLTNAKNQAASTVQTLQLENRVRDLAEEVDRLRAEKQILEAKLREALAAQPPVNDPAEINRADEKIRTLSKELEVLRAGLEQEKNRQQATTQSREAGEKALAEANRRLAAQADTLSRLSREREEALEKLRAAQKSSPRPAPTQNPELQSENERLRKELAAERQKNSRAAAKQAETALKKEVEAIESKLRDQLKQNEVLISEKRTLQTRADQLAAELARLKTPPSPSASPNLPPAAPNITQQQLAAAKLETAAALKDKAALEERISALTLELKIAKQSRPDESRAQRRDRTRQLEAERDELKRQLATKTSTPPASKSETERLRLQLAAIQAKVDVYEMKKDPFTPEELALFKKPAPSPAPAQEAKRTQKKSVKELPASASKLMAEAQSAFSSRKLEDAEKKYEEVLRLDLENVYTLANLGLVQMEQGRLEPAEANLSKALALEPKDAYSLSLLGILKFRQSKLDEALDLLSRSSKIDPKNAETQNYLGVVLSQKGMRGPAEAAMRRSIQINPSYAEAHHNLAVIYISQNPPFVELARWHYEKALSAGHPRNPSLENYFDKRAGQSD